MFRSVQQHLTAFLLTFFIVVSTGFTTYESKTIQEWYSQGLEEIDKGNVQKALEIWQHAKFELQQPSLLIGREYLKTAVEHGFTEYYPAATAMYMWGLSGKDTEDLNLNSKEIEKEIELLRPLVNEALFRSWNNQFESNDPAIFSSLTAFWEELDPTPSRIANERLVEHWNRISHARENYPLEDNPPYDTDSRGDIIVRFGHPDEIKNVKLDVKPGEIYNFTLFWLNVNINRFLGNDAHQYARDIEIAALEMFGEPRNLEIWKYNPGEEGPDDLYFLFLQNPDDTFEQIRAIDELVPPRAFSLSARSYNISAFDIIDFGLTPGAAILWQLYSKLALTDPVFIDFFNRVDSNLFFTSLDDPVTKKYLGGQLRFQNIHDAAHMRSLAGNQVFSADNHLATFAMEVYQYRFLDEDNKPALITIVESYPSEAAISNYLLGNNLSISDDTVMNVDKNDFDLYQVLHGVQLRDKNQSLITQSRSGFKNVRDYNGQNPNVQIFSVPHLNTDISQIFYAELIDKDNKKTGQPKNKLFPGELVGLQKVQLPQPGNPLVYDDEVMLISDIIVGYDKTGENGLNGDTIKFPFTISHDKNLPHNSSLVLYFELYNLMISPGGTANFDLNYELKMKNFIGKSTVSNGNIEFEHDSKKFNESIEIESENFKPGNYILELEFIDKNRNYSINRTIEFDVLDDNN